MILRYLIRLVEAGTSFFTRSTYWSEFTKKPGWSSMQYAVCCMQKEKSMSGKNYQDLIAWRKAMDLVKMIYKVTKDFPKEEVYGLTAQIRRAAVSIPSNIAEGQGRTSSKEFQNFLSIAHGSVREVETQILIAQHLNYLPTEQAQHILNQAGEVGRLIKGLWNSLSRK